MAEFQDLVKKVLDDAAFRKALLADPVGVLKREGIEPTPEMLDALRDVDEESLTALAQNFLKSDDAAR